MSADGNVVAFATARHEPVDRGHRRNDHTDVFVRVVSTDPTELVSRTYTDAGISRPAGRRLLHVDLRRRALRRVRRRGGEPHRRGRELRRRRGRARPRRGHDDAREPGDGRHRCAGRLPLVGSRRSRPTARRVAFATAGRQPRLDLEPGPGDALASPQRLRPRPGRRHHGARQPRERGERGARQRRLRRPAGARDLRRRHEGRVPLAGDEPRVRHARVGRLQSFLRNLATNTTQVGGGRRGELAAGR